MNCIQHRCALLTAFLLASCATAACGGCGEPGSSDNASTADGGDRPRPDAGSPDVGERADGARSDAGKIDFGDPGTPGEPWIDVTPGGRSPAPPLSPELVYDEAHQQVVVVADAQTWVWTGEIWEMVAPAPEPAGREGFALAYDAAREQVVMYGGWTQLELETFGDTWVWDGMSWAELAPAMSPPATFNHEMAYDAVREQVVLYGGGGQAGLPRYEDTWVWDGATWTMLESAAGTGPRSPLGMAYDAARQTLVMYAQDGPGVTGIWEFDGSEWQEVDQGATVPSLRGETAVVYDAIGERILLAGGQNTGNIFRDTWAWDGESWSDVTTEVGELPSGQFGHVAAFDAMRGEVMLFGGVRHTGVRFPARFSETYLIRDGAWTDVSPDATPLARDGASMAYDSEREVVVLYGGFPAQGGSYFRDTWTWDGSFWRRVVTDSLPGNQFQPAMAFDPVRKEVVLFGGATTGGDNETFTWDGNQWELQPTGDTPSADVVSRMVWDAAHEYVLLHDYRSSWSWDGTSWALLDDTSPVEPYGPGALVYDPVRRAPILFGAYVGQDGTYITTVWAWDGTTWAEVMTGATRPEVQNNSAAFWDSRRSSLVSFGGSDPRAVVSGETWELSGDTWRNLTPESGPTARQRHGMAFDNSRNRGVLFGGEGSTAKTWEWIGSAALLAE